MNIFVLGRGNVGGGLARRWERAGHSVTRIGKDGGDVSEADAVLIAVPGGAIADALGKVQGLEGKAAIDATNLFGADRPSGFNSNAEFVKSKTNAPTARPATSGSSSTRCCACARSSATPISPSTYFLVRSR